MNTEPTAQTRLEPNIIQVESLGVGLYRTNDTMNLASNQFLVIGEGTVGNDPSLVQHTLIVDNTGLAINASITERDAVPNRGYAVYVKGDLMVEGTIRGNEFTSNPPTSIGVDRLWSTVSYNVNNNIYSTQQVNISTELQARSNTHKFNIVATPNRDIQRSHLNLQNTELSQMRLGILGNASNSPVVFNTTSNVPIEFHIGRDRAYFSNLYTEPLYGNPNQLLDLNTPRYTHSSNAPHLVLDATGSVGIRTSESQTYSYARMYRTVTQQSNTYAFSNTTERMGLYVKAPMYADDILIYDAISGQACNIDSLYVRALGPSFEASQIRPGAFSHGTFVFTSNVLLTLPTPTHSEIALNVAGNTLFGCNVSVNGLLTAEQTAFSNLTVYGNGRFTNQLTSDNTLTASNVLRFGTFLQTIGPDGQWCNVDFTVRSPDSYCNVEELGGNVYIRNRLAVGLSLSNAEEVGTVFTQQVHIDKTAYERYELSLGDRTLQPWNRKFAVIGHGAVDNAMLYEDASLVIATGTPTEDYYNGVKIFKSMPELPQNVYFYPGQYEHSNVYRPLIRPDNPPVLGVFYDKTVGIGTFHPRHTFHTQGDIYASGDYYTRHPTEANQSIPLAKFYQNNFIGRIGIPPFYAAAEYINPQAPRLGIHTTAQYEYGMTLAGSLKLADGAIYDPTGTRTGHWYQSGPTTTIYTPRTVGIGVTTTVYPLELYEAGTTRPTYLTIQANQVEVEAAPNYSKGGIRFNAANQTWVAEAGVPYANRAYVKQSFAIYDTRSTGSNVLLAGQYFVEGRHQLYVGAIYDAGDYGPSNSTYDDALVVGGNTTIFGSLKITSNLDVDGLLSLRGTYVTISGGSNATPVALANNPNDVLITGSIVHLLPAATDPNSTATFPAQPDPARESYVSIGFTQDTDLTLTQRSDLTTYPVFRVHQYINSDTISKFSTKGPYGLMDIETGRNGADVSGRMRYGLDMSTGQPSLVFLDRTNPSQPRHFLKSTKQTNNAIFAAFNLPTGAPADANLHVYNDDTGDKMLRLQFVSPVDSVTNAPTVLLHRDNTSTSASYQWAIKGPRPDALQLQEQKLSFVYQYDQPGYTSSNAEVLTLLSGGKVGINQSSPSYALDLRCTQPHHAIRLYNPNESSTGMLLFQSGPSNAFGGDASIDYRWYTSNQGLYLDQQSTTNGLVSVLQVDSNAHLGIGTVPTAAYQMNVAGYLNVEEGLLINGFPFLYRQTTSNIITGGLRVDDNGNIFINPVSFVGNTLDEPGLVIGAGVASSNLLHIYSGSNANLTVYDSIYEEAQVHYRTRNASTGSNSTFRWFASNQRFQMEYLPTHLPGTKIDDGHSGYVPLVAWEHGTSVNGGTMTVTGDIVFQTGTGEAKIQMPSGASWQGMSNGDLVVMPGAQRGVGIGTTAAAAVLDVAGSTGRDALYVHSTGGIPLIVQETGYVGIGTTMAQSPLHVEGAVVSTNLWPRTTSASVGTSGQAWSNVYAACNLFVGTAGLSNTVVNQTPTLRLHDTGGLATVQYQRWMAGDLEGDTALFVERSESSNVVYITSNVSLQTEVQRVIPLVYSPSTRRVGIRTETPGAVLDIAGGAGDTVPTLRVLGAHSDSNVPVWSASSSNGQTMVFTGEGRLGIGTTVTDAVVSIRATGTELGLHLHHEGTGDLLRLNTVDSNVLWVKNDGRVGVGTTAPTAALHVQGDIVTSGTLTASNLNVINLTTTDVEIMFSEQVSITNTGTDIALKVVQTGNAPIVELQYGALEDPKTTAVYVGALGNVGIGTTAPVGPLHVEGPVFSRPAFASAGALPSASLFAGMTAGVSNATDYRPYFATGASWSPLAFYDEMLAAIEDRKSLKFVIESVAFSPSNIVLSGDGIYPNNSNVPQLNVYRGFTYRFSNVSSEILDLTSNTGSGYVGIEVGIQHDNPTSNASPTDRYVLKPSEQVRFTVPMDAVVGSNYQYQLHNDPALFGVICVV